MYKPMHVSKEDQCTVTKEDTQSTLGEHRSNYRFTHVKKLCVMSSLY